MGGVVSGSRGSADPVLARRTTSPVSSSELSAPSCFITAPSVEIKKTLFKEITFPAKILETEAAS